MIFFIIIDFEKNEKTLTSLPCMRTDALPLVLATVGSSRLAGSSSAVMTFNLYRELFYQCANKCLAM